VCSLFISAVMWVACSISSACDHSDDEGKTKPPCAFAKRCAFAKMAACAKNASEKKTTGVHPGVTCDRSGMSPIVGMRYHLRGHDWDLCQAEFDKCPAGEKALYSAIPPPCSTRGRPTVREQMHKHAEEMRTKEHAAQEAPPAAAAAAPPPPRAAPQTIRYDASSVRIQKTSDDQEVHVSIAVPGVRSSDLNVNALGDVIRVTGATTRGGSTYCVHRELDVDLLRRRGGGHVDIESLRASHEHGILTLVMGIKSGKRIPVLAEQPAAVSIGPAMEPAVAGTRTDEEKEQIEQIEQPAAAAEKEEAVLESTEEHGAEAEAASSSDEWVPLAG